MRILRTTSGLVARDAAPGRRAARRGPAWTNSTLAPDVAERRVPHRALGDERRESHDGALSAHARVGSRTPRPRAGRQSNGTSTIRPRINRFFLGGGGVRAGRRQEEWIPVRAATWLCAGARSWRAGWLDPGRGRTGARAEQAVNSERSCCITDTLCASASRTATVAGRPRSPRRRSGGARMLTGAAHRGSASSTIAAS